MRCDVKGRFSSISCVASALCCVFLPHVLLPLPDEKVDLNDSKWEDIHVTTGALKMFFRELPEPLFTYGSFNDFVNAISELFRCTNTAHED